MADKLFKKGRFSFIGGVSASKEPLSTSVMGTSDWKKTRLGVGIKNDQNLQFLNMEYIHSDKVKTCRLFGTDGEQFEVNLTDTDKDEVKNKVADFSKITIDLETDFEKKKEYTKLIFKKRNHEFKKEEEKTDEGREKIKEYDAQIKELATNRLTFCHMKDAIIFLNSSLPILEGKKVRVNGDIKSNFYNGKNVLQYVPNYIEIVPDDTENQLKAYIDLFYDKDSIDDDKDLKKMIVNGYIGERIKKADKLYPLTVVVDYTKIDESNDLHKALLEMMKSNFAITDKKQVHKIGLELNVINGSPTIEFDASCLTDKQRMAITVGLNKLEDFKPKGNVYGDKVTELRVVKGDLKEYPEGAIEVFSVKDLEDYLVQDDSDVSAKDVKVKDKPKAEDKSEEVKTETPEDMMAKLFG